MWIVLICAAAWLILGAWGGSMLNYPGDRIVRPLMGVMAGPVIWIVVALEWSERNRR